MSSSWCDFMAFRESASSQDENASTPPPPCLLRLRHLNSDTLCKKDNIYHLYASRAVAGGGAKTRRNRAHFLSNHILADKAEHMQTLDTHAVICMFESM